MKSQWPTFARFLAKQSSILAESIAKWNGRSHQAISSIRSRERPKAKLLRLLTRKDNKIVVDWTLQHPFDLTDVLIQTKNWVNICRQAASLFNSKFFVLLKRAAGIGVKIKPWATGAPRKIRLSQSAQYSLPMKKIQTPTQRASPIECHEYLPFVHHQPHSCLSNACRSGASSRSLLCLSTCRLCQHPSAPEWPHWCCHTTWCLATAHQSQRAGN